MNPARIVLVDCEFGNFGSIVNMIKKAGGSVLVSRRPEDLLEADKIILPGVGAFDRAVENLKSKGYWDVLSEQVMKRKVPILGICLGMQLFSRSSEEGNLDGFGWIPARVVKFSFQNQSSHLKIPHMGWNRVAVQKASPLYDNLTDSPRFYFVHSYHLKCDNDGCVTGVTRHGYDFISSIHQDNIYGTQFHPEKSHRFGLALIRNFVEKC